MAMIAEWSRVANCRTAFVEFSTRVGRASTFNFYVSIVQRSPQTFSKAILLSGFYDHLFHIRVVVGDFAMLCDLPLIG